MSGLRGEAGAASAALGRVRINEVEALPHQRLLVVEDHAVQIDEALRIHEDPVCRRIGRRLGIEMLLREAEHAIALTRLAIETDVVAEPGAAAARNAKPKPPGSGLNVLLSHRRPNPLQSPQSYADALGTIRL